MTGTEQYRRTPTGTGVNPAHLIAAASGGALGSVGRYALSLHWPASVGALRATVVVTVVGCCVLGFVLGAAAGRSRSQRAMRAFAIGLCGGFASFSMYAVLGVTFATAWKGVVFLVLTPVVALSAMWVASVVGRTLTTR